MARVEKCCCFSLKTGTLIIATLGWIFTLLKLFGLMGTIGNSNYREPQRSNSFGNEDFRQIDDESTMSSSSLGYRIGYAVIALICCVLLVIGIYKKSHNYFIPYLIVTCLEAVGITILTVVIFVFIFMVPSGAQLFMGIMFVFMVLATALAWYFWTVVYSYYHVVKAEEAGVPPGGGNVYYSPTSNNPPPYNEKNRTPIA